MKSYGRGSGEPSGMEYSVMTEGLQQEIHKNYPPPLQLLHHL